MFCIGAEDVKKIDLYAAESLAISTSRLMGNVGVFVADTLSAMYGNSTRVLILSGSGNNGGDGYAAAYELTKRGLFCAVLAFGEPRAKESRDYRERFTLCGGDVRDGLPFAELLYAEEAENTCENVNLGFHSSSFREWIASFDLVVDALIGSGFSGELRERTAAVCRYLNTHFVGKRVAIDLPTGLDGSTGEAARDSFRADLTLSLGFPKRGMYSPVGRALCGEIRHSDIGLPIAALTEVFKPHDILTDEAFLREQLPKRAHDSSKGSFGHAYLLVGSERYPGAALLAAEGALYMGAGYTQLLSTGDACRLALTRMPSLLTEAVFPSDYAAFAKNPTAAAARGALLIGCGLSSPPELLSLLYALFETEGGPLILDADALNALARDRENALSRLSHARRDILLTPHPLEFSRLTGKSVEEIQASRYRAAAEFARAHHVTLLLKGYASVIASPDGRVFQNPTGGSGLAKAGSGDVLAGAIVSLAASGMPLPEAAACAAYLHGLAGDRLSQRYSVYGVRPDELPREMAAALAEILNETEADVRPSSARA